MKYEPRTVFLWPRWGFILSMAALLPFAFIMLSIFAFVILSELGFDLGARFVRSTSEPHQPLTWDMALVMGFMALVSIYGVVTAMLHLFSRFSRGRLVGTSMFEFRPLIGRWQRVLVSDIAGYSDCSYPAWSRRNQRGHGIALYLTNGSHIQVNDIQLHGLPELVLMLNERDIKLFGSETTWFYPFMKRRYKFDRT